MADIKTNLREISVAVGISIALKKESIESLGLLNPNDFYKYASSIIQNDISSAKNITDLDYIDGEYKTILNNGLKLGEAIVNKFDITSIKELVWCGGDTQKDDPIDLKVNSIMFSLKEKSFILENMGLYKLLSLLTTSTFKRGLHIFNRFSKKEYEKWFNYTLNKAIEIANGWEISNDRYTSSIYVSNQALFLKYIYSENVEVVSKIPNNSSTETYKKMTNHKTREKVFSKWIKEQLNNDTTYLKLKKECSERAGKELCLFITQNLKQDGLQRLLQVRDFEYFYAKTTQNGTTILKVPSSNDFGNKIKIKSVKYYVPKSQLNIITTIENYLTGAQLKIRNECRFSHGQFNGTPEAKMYYDGDLLTIYQEI